MLRSFRELTAVSQPRAVGSITLAHGANEFFSIAFPPIIPFLVSDLGITYAEAGILLTIFFIMYSVFQLPAGVLSDWFGKKLLLIAGLAIMTGGILLASTAPNYEVLLVGQAIAGIGGSTFHPTGMALISDIETGGTEGKAMGVFGFGGVLGTMASPIVIGGLAAVADWRVALVGATVLGVLVLGIFSLAFTESAVRQDDHEEVQTDGGRSFTLSSIWRVLKGLLDIPRTRGMIIILVVTFFLSMMMRATSTFTTSYIAAEVGGSASVGNFGFFVLLVGGGVSSLGAGGLADRFNRSRLGGIAGVASAVLIGATVYVSQLFTSLQTEFVYLLLAIWFFLIGAMMYAMSPVKNALVAEQSERHFSGSLFGVIQTGSAVGSAAGPAAIGVLATKWGVIAAYPAIAVIALIVAGLFFLLSVVD